MSENRCDRLVRLKMLAVEKEYGLYSAITVNIFLFYLSSILS